MPEQAINWHSCFVGTERTVLHSQQEASCFQQHQLVPSMLVPPGCPGAGPLMLYRLHQCTPRQCKDCLSWVTSMMPTCKSYSYLRVYLHNHAAWLTPLVWHEMSDAPCCPKSPLHQRRQAPSENTHGGPCGSAHAPAGLAAPCRDQ